LEKQARRRGVSKHLQPQTNGRFPLPLRALINWRNIYIPTMSRKTAQLFDLMFKSIIKDASSSAVVHLINGIYKKNYPLDTMVTIEPNELIKEHPKSGKMEKIVSDIIITLHSENKKDTFLLEAQIDDDLEMILRIFNYSTLIALDKKTVSADGSCMRIEMLTF